jgi:hypothetical protein
MRSANPFSAFLRRIASSSTRGYSASGNAWKPLTGDAEYVAERAEPAEPQGRGRQVCEQPQVAALS